MINIRIFSKPYEKKEKKLKMVSKTKRFSVHFLGPTGPTMCCLFIQYIFLQKKKKNTVDCLFIACYCCSLVICSCHCHSTEQHLRFEQAQPKI